MSDGPHFERKAASLIFIGDSVRREAGGSSAVLDAELWINMFKVLPTVAPIVSTAQLFNDSAAPEY